MVSNDLVTDFSQGADKIVLAASAFQDLNGSSTLASSDYGILDTADVISDTSADVASVTAREIVFQTVNFADSVFGSATTGGILYYNGSPFATINMGGNLALTTTDFTINSDL